MANKDVIIACDFGTREETLAFLDRFCLLYTSRCV